jgi:hypothetical protein
MVLSYARGSWRFKLANLVASSVAVAIRYSKLVGKFSGNGGLVASLVVGGLIVGINVQERDHVCRHVGLHTWFVSW